MRIAALQTLTASHPFTVAPFGSCGATTGNAEPNTPRVFAMPIRQPPGFGPVTVLDPTPHGERFTVNRK